MKALDQGCFVMNRRWRWSGEVRVVRGVPVRTTGELKVEEGAKLRWETLAEPAQAESRARISSGMLKLECTFKVSSLASSAS